MGTAEGVAAVWDVAACQPAWRGGPPSTRAAVVAVCWTGPGPRRWLAVLHQGNELVLCDPWAGGVMWAGQVGDAATRPLRAMTFDPGNRSTLLAWGPKGNLTLVAVQVERNWRGVAFVVSLYA